MSLSSFVVCEEHAHSFEIDIWVPSERAERLHLKPLGSAEASTCFMLFGLTTEPLGMATVKKSVSGRWHSEKARVEKKFDAMEFCTSPAVRKTST